MENIKSLLVAESTIALVLLGVIMYLFIAGGLPLTGDLIITPNTGNNLPVEIVEPNPDPISNPSPIFIYVTATTPTDSSYNQGVYSNIIVTFSEQVFSSTVNSNTFIVHGPNNIALAGTITSDFTGKVWTFNPVDSFEYNTLYTIIITTDVVGVSGNTLLRNYIFNFTTQYSSGGSGGGGGSSPTPAPLVLTKISLTPTSRNISTGNSFQLNATGLDQNSNQFNTTINYTSSNESVANVSSSGFVTALSVGNTTISASNGTITNSSLVIVVEAVFTSINFSSESQNISAGNDFQLNVSGYDQNQDTIDVLINYTSSNESVATVNSTGFVTTLLPGNTTITASNGSINDTFVLNVFEAVLTSITLTSLSETIILGNTTQLNATGFDQYNDMIVILINYTSSNESVAIVNSTGFVNTTGAGTTIINASNGTVSNNITITVYSPTLTRIDLTPSSVILPLGESRQLNATGFDQYNDTMVVLINYNSSNESVATVNSTGFVNVTGLGNTTITAFNGSITNTSLIQVVDLSACPVVSVNLGTAGDFAILTKSGISTTGTTNITGDIGVSPIDSTAITGFGLIMHGSGTYSTSSLITGKVYAADYTSPTDVKMTTAIGDMETAYSTSNGLAACVNELGAGNIGGMTLSPGVYKWSTDLNMPTSVTLSGTATDVWVFQISGKLDLASATDVNLIGGALAKNIYWVVGDTVTLGTTSTLNGNVLAKTNIDLLNGATLNGRALAQTAVTLDGNPVTKPTD